jgi:hypothetical protein
VEAGRWARPKRIVWILVSSSTKADQAMAENKIMNLYEYWKALTMDEKDITNFHTVGWLLGSLLYTPTTLEFPTINHTRIVYFESHLMCGLSLPPSKFLVVILNYMGYELIHLHPSAVVGSAFP